MPGSQEFSDFDKTSSEPELFEYTSGFSSSLIVPERNAGIRYDFKRIDAKAFEASPTISVAGWQGQCAVSG